MTVSDEDASIVQPVISCHVFNITNARDVGNVGERQLKESRFN